VAELEEQLFHLNADYKQLKATLEEEQSKRLVAERKNEQLEEQAGMVS